MIMLSTNRQALRPLKPFYKREPHFYWPYQWQTQIKLTLCIHIYVNIYQIYETYCILYYEMYIFCKGLVFEYCFQCCCFFFFKVMPDSAIKSKRKQISKWSRHGDDLIVKRAGFSICGSTSAFVWLTCCVCPGRVYDAIYRFWLWFGKELVDKN